jgi:L-ascorbate metabolism protein UlaG (beta-lactamase superfamily)
MCRLAAVLAGLIAFASPAVAQAEKGKAISIRWFGQSFFQIETGDGTRIVIDPHLMTEYSRPSCEGDLILISHEHDDHNLVEAVTNLEKDKPKIIRGLLTKGKRQDWNKVDEKVKNIHIRTVPSYHDAEEGLKRGKNGMFVIETDGLKIAHLGDLGHVLSDEQVKAIGEIDILMIPIGGIYTINGEKAKEVMKQLKPRLYVLPMHYGTKVLDTLQEPDEFLEGQKNVRKLEQSNVLSIPTNLKLDKPTIVLMQWASAP